MSKVSRREILYSGALVAAGSLLLKPAFAHSDLLATVVEKAEGAGVIEGIPEIDLAPREHLLFDFDWRFLHGHATDPAKDLNLGADQGDFAKTGDFHFAQPKFDDSQWRTLNLPHDWAVELPFVNDPALTSHGYKPLGRKYPETSVGWYRRTFDIPREDEGRRICINFDGIFRSALVFCNGVFIGRSDSGYAPFGFDLTDFLNYGKANSITVRVDASYGDGWFYEGAGIYRHVWLTKLDPLHIGQWETVVRTEIQPGGARLSLNTSVENTGSAKEICSVQWRIIDESGKTVATAESPDAEIPIDGKQIFTAPTKLVHPAIWSLEHPTLYYAVATVESNGKVRDRDRASFGIRTLAWDLDKGFLLNGVRTPIQGTCNHQDHAGVGAAVPDRLQAFRMEVLKGMGCNAIRTSHNIPTPELIEACDRLGVLVMCETRIMSSSDEGLAQLSTMIRRFRNHPSIFLWSMGNEEWELERDLAGPRVIRAMQQRTHELDPTRQCTAAVNGYWDKPMAPCLDVMGFNYNLSQIDQYHKDHPKQFGIGTEIASAVFTRGIYSNDKLRNWVSSYDKVYADTNVDEGQAWWNFYGSRSWLAGGFAWTGFDYRGEPSPYAWPSVSSQFGIVDTCGFPKDTYFHYKAWWDNKPLLHLLPHWNWPGREGEEILVQAESNLDSVELFLNGKSLGSKNVVPQCHLEWRVNYTPGVLEARASKNGKVVLTETRRTTGPAARIVLTADRTEISADGEDIAIIRVEAVDKNGLPVPDADIFVRFKVEGEGSVIGVGNGDPNCQQSDKKPERSLFNGLAQVIVQGIRKPGPLMIHATSDRAESAILTVITKEAKLRPAVATSTRLKS
jgi:beta-galactosidase